MLSELLYAVGKGGLIVLALVFAAWVATGCHPAPVLQAPAVVGPDPVIDRSTLWVSRETGSWGVDVRIPAEAIREAGPGASGRVTLLLEDEDRGQLAIDTVTVPAVTGWQTAGGTIDLTAANAAGWAHVVAYVCRPDTGEGKP